MEQQPSPIPPKRDTKEDVSQRYEKHLVWLKKKTEEVEQKTEHRDMTIQPIDVKSEAAGEGSQHDNELIMDTDGQWVLKKYADQ